LNETSDQDRRTNERDDRRWAIGRHAGLCAVADTRVEQFEHWQRAKVEGEKERKESNVERLRGSWLSEEEKEEGRRRSLSGLERKRRLSGSERSDDSGNERSRTWRERAFDLEEREDDRERAISD
jgi:hypothetical protein